MKLLDAALKRAGLEEAHRKRGLTSEEWARVSAHYELWKNTDQRHADQLVEFFRSRQAAHERLADIWPRFWRKVGWLTLGLTVAGFALYALT